jgi:hypothetical protein
MRFYSRARRKHPAWLWLTCVALLVIGPVTAAEADPASHLRIDVKGQDGHPAPCRIHLFDSKGTAQRPKGFPFWHDHFVCAGEAAIELSPGAYRYAVERGPEFARKSGTIDVVTGKEAVLSLTLGRIANLRGRGWFSADLHVHRPVEEIELLMKAEDLDFAPVITWWNNQNLWKDRDLPQPTVRSFDGRLYDVMAGEDEREGGALLYFGLDRPLDLAGSKREFPSPMKFVAQAKNRNGDVWIDIEKPFWWDVPVWLAGGKTNSIGLANNHMCRSSMYRDEAWGRPRDRRRLPDPLGNGYWTQEIYYHVLESGLRLPPSAGSASGVLPNPVGYNRVYTHLEGEFTVDKWFESLAKGRCFVTNGPLLLASANGQLPGSVFKLNDGGQLEVEVVIELTSSDRVPRLELIHNGQVVKTIECQPVLSQQRRVKFTVKEPGWFLIRAIADVKSTFRFASTAAWHVESETGPGRISRRSAQFFLDWVNERAERVKANISDEQEQRDVLKWHDEARRFWSQRVANATAE